MVLGFETDFQGADINDSFDNKRLDRGNTWINAGYDVNWFGTARGRLGFAWDRVLVYGTGGFAYGDVDFHVRHVDVPRNVTTRFSRNDIDTGFAVGGGVEVAWAPNWTTKLEYQFIDLDRDDNSNARSRFGRHLSKDSSVDFHTVRLGVNWKFGYEAAPPPPAAAVVKY